LKLAEITRLSTGGWAAVARVSSVKELKDEVRSCSSYRVLGNGSNVIIADSGVSEKIIKLDGEFKKIRIKGNKVIAGGGVLLKDVLKKCAEASLAGLENLAGIPASVGGAVFKNASAFGCEICGLLERIKFIDGKGAGRALDCGSMSYSYRTGPLKRGQILTQACFVLKKGSSEKISARIRNNILERSRRGFMKKNATGSLFKNPPGGLAGKIIQDAGLSGLCRGSAAVSPRHANVLSLGANPKAEDAYNLMTDIRKAVLFKKNVYLEPLIEFWGTFSRKMYNSGNRDGSDKWYLNDKNRK